VNQAFDYFEHHRARVSDEDNADAKAVHPEIRMAVSDALPVLRDFLSGSYGRRVQAVVLRDIDLIVVLDDPNWVYRRDAHGTLLRIQGALSDSDLVRLAAKPSVRAAKAWLKDYEFHFDIVPALVPAVGEGLYLTNNRPDEGVNEWTLEYPEQQREACREKNRQTGGRYVPATRVVRAWNQRYSTIKPLRSYHAEALLYHAIPESATLQEAVLAFFDYAHESLAIGRLTPTPGAPSGRWVDDRLAPEDRVEAAERVGAAREQAHKAADTEGPGEAMVEWQKVFGDTFPSPETHPDIVEAAMRSGTAFAVGAGIRSGRKQEGRDVIPRRSWRRF
jgi:hypothetical protein